MKPEQIAALAAAGYSKADIEAMDAKPVTLESLSAEVAKLTAAVSAQQAANLKGAQQETPPTAAEILAGITAVTPPEQG